MKRQTEKYLCIKISHLIVACPNQTLKSAIKSIADVYLRGGKEKRGTFSGRIRSKKKRPILVDGGPWVV